MDGYIKFYVIIIGYFKIRGLKAVKAEAVAITIAAVK